MPCMCVAAAYLGIWQLIGTSPHTVSFDMERWENSSWGLHNIERDRLSGTVATFADGSRVNQATVTHFGHYFIRTSQRAVHYVYRRPANILYEVDDQARTTTVWRCCTWDEPSRPLPDRQCRGKAKDQLGDAIRVGAGAVAGIPVIRYRATGKDLHEAAYAPQFGCDLLEERSAKYNLIGIPTSWVHFIVRSYVPGEPKRESLDPPAGYAVRKKPLLSP